MSNDRLVEIAINLVQTCVRLSDRVKELEEELGKFTPRAWEGLTDGEIGSIFMEPQTFKGYARAIEAKLKEKNNG